MTSTCSQSAAPSTARASSARRAKSAARMLGAMISEVRSRGQSTNVTGTRQPIPVPSSHGSSGYSSLPSPCRRTGGSPAGTRVVRDDAVAVRPTAQQGQEHRVGAVPVRPELHGRARRPGRACRPAATGGRRRSSTVEPRAARRLGDRHLRLDQVRRAGHVGDHARPAGPPAAPRPSSSRCSLVSGGRSDGWRRQRDSGRRRSEPSPVHGASTSTRSNAALGQVGIRADRRGRRRRAPSTGRPRTPARPAGPGAGAPRPRSAWAPRCGGERAEQRRPCRPGRRTGPASARRGPRAARRPARRRPAGEPSSCTWARPSRIAGRSPGAPPGR